MNSKLTIKIALFFFVASLTVSQAQRKDTVMNEIKVLARPSLDSIVLRWAPINVAAWLKGNTNGYVIERYTIVRDNKVLSLPEKRILSINPMKPLPLDRWEQEVKRNKYAAIAAQSLYGDSFQLTTQGTDIFQIVNKVKENEQRFSFALFAADMSAPVSVLLGLRHTDKNVKKGEKYLYRISATSPGDTLRGSVFTGPEAYTLPAPADFTATFEGKIVSLKWNQSYYKGIYSAFVVERSSNGKDFKALSEDPLVTLSEADKEETRYQYATDSLPDETNEYHYRVRGFTPFGELGPPSEPVKGKGAVALNDTPHIIKGGSENNKTIQLGWEFPSESNNGLKGFQVQRAESPKQPYKTINTTLISKEIRDYEDMSPKQTNYYQVVAIALNGEEFKSPVYYAQLIDSIPPSAPKGLNGNVSQTGKISISWTPNAEPDMYGYRIYRGNYLKEEFSQITREPIRPYSFTDSVDLKHLNKQIHYQVMAIDRNQNYSVLSEVLTLELPDKVKPVPPFFYPVSSSREGVLLQWTPSSSDDVDRYDLYRKEGSVWKKITSQVHTADTLYKYADKESPEGKQRMYTVVAIDKSGLESDPSSPVAGAKITNPIKPAVVLSEPDVDRENKKIVLKWVYSQQGVNAYQVYRSKEGQPLKLHSTVTAAQFEDKQLNMNSIYIYRVVALFTSGAKSEFSKDIKVKY